MRDAELLTQRLQSLSLIDPYVGRYYSKEWVNKNVLHLTDDELEEMKKQIESEPAPVQVGPDGNPMEQEQEQDTQEELPPEDNVTEKDTAESETPDLDNVVQKFSRKLINR